MLFLARCLAPDKDANPLLSRRLRRLSTLLLLGLSGFDLTAASVTAQAREWYRARLGLSAAPSPPPAQADTLAEAILQSDSLRTSYSLAFESYAAFMQNGSASLRESVLQ